MKNGSEKIWRLKGAYLESCNCDIVCPCLVNGIGNNAMPATEGHCDLLLGYTIEKGHWYDIDLSGLNFSIMIYSAGPLMSVPNWSIAYYIDDRADDRQYEALCNILSGEAGGPPAGLRDLREVLLGIKRAKVAMEVGEKIIKVTIDGIGEAAVNAIKGVYDDKNVMITNIHPQTVDVVQGITGRMWYSDYGYNFNNTGRSGLMAKYIWEDKTPVGLREAG